MKKRILAMILACLMAVSIFSGCSSNTDPSSSTSETSTESSTAESSAADSSTDSSADSSAVDVDKTATGESEDYYTYFTSEVGTLNYLVSNKAADSDVYALLVDALIIVERDGTYTPGMATEWSVSEDGLTYTLKLREDLMWKNSDGSEYGKLTANDFVYPISQVLDPANASLVVDFVLDNIEGAADYYDKLSKNEEADFSTVGVKAVDDYTLEYKLSWNCPYFLSLLTYSCYMPVNEKFVEEIGGIEVFGTDKDNFLYCGEYLLQEWNLDQDKTLIKNEDYYYADRVHVGMVNFVMVDDSSTALEMYKRGELSAAPVSADKVDNMMADPEYGDYVYMTSLTSASWAYYFNFASPNENFVTAALNTSFRKAIAAGLDRVTLLSSSNRYAPEDLVRNTLNIWNLSIDENGDDYMTHGELQAIEERDSYNPEAAVEYMKTAVEELGDSVQWPVTIQLSVQNTQTVLDQAELFKQTMEELLGEYVVVEFATYEAENYYQVQEEGNFDFTYGGWIPDYADPSSYLEIYMTNGYIGVRTGFDKCEDAVTYSNMVADAKAVTDSLSARYDAMAEAEVYGIENAIFIPYRAQGGNYAISNIQNPHEQLLAVVPYGTSACYLLDLIVGDSPLTAAEREALLG